MCFGSCCIVWWRNGCSVDNKINVAHIFKWSFLFFSAVALGGLFWFILLKNFLAVT